MRYDGDLDELVLDKNEDPIIGLNYGSNGQLTVIGFTRKYKKRGKMYVSTCNICSQDTELFGNGLFRSSVSQINNNEHPCACGLHYKKNSHEYEILIKRICNKKGVEFVGFKEPFKNGRSYIKLSCKKHGVWESSNIETFINREKSGCPACASELAGNRVRLTDEEVLLKIKESGQYHPDTCIVRSNRLNKNGHKVYFNITCGRCKESVESLYTTILKSGIGCKCSIHNQTTAYIASISDVDNNIEFLKFGISNNVDFRINRIQEQCNYKIDLVGKWKFQDITSCKNAEKYCKLELECAILPPEDFKSGWTETTDISNLNAIISIYESNGGVKDGV